MENLPPSPTADNGRASNGRFGPGNSYAKGNPFAKKTAELRAALLAGVSAKDLRAVTKKLVSMATAGDLAAIRELYDRVLGKRPAIELAELEFRGNLDEAIETELRRLAAKRQG